MKKQKQKFISDIKSIAKLNSYNSVLVDSVITNAESYIEVYDLWSDAFNRVNKELNLGSINDNELPILLEEKLTGRFKNNKISEKTIIGIAGPGAVGKDTFIKSIGLPCVINTTTRSKRGYEINHVHYHFVNEDEYKKLNDDGKLLLCNEKSGRGWYGIQLSDIENVFADSVMAAVIESPKNLLELSNQLCDKNIHYDFVLVYLLPQAPVLAHLALRLEDRCYKAGDDCSADVIKSTLGQRQVDEFLSLLDIINSDTNCIVLVNDRVERIADRFRILFPRQ